MGVCFVDLEKTFNCVLQDFLQVMGGGGRLVRFLCDWSWSLACIADSKSDCFQCMMDFDSAVLCHRFYS